jgi:hypothetical protein
MIFKVAITLAIGVLVALGQIYPPPGDETETPDATETAIPPLVTAAPGTATPYPAPTPAGAGIPADSSPPNDTGEPRLIGSGNQQANGLPAAERNATPPDSAGNLLFLWIAFLAALTIFITGIAGSILLFTRKRISGK